MAPNALAQLSFVCAILLGNITLGYLCDRLLRNLPLRSFEPQLSLMGYRLDKRCYSSLADLSSATSYRPAQPPLRPTSQFETHVSRARIGTHWKMPTLNDATFKVFIYDMPSKFVNESFQWNLPLFWQSALSQQYDTEIAVVNFFRRHSKFATSDPEAADLFLIPLFMTHMGGNPEGGWGGKAVKESINYIKLKYPYWKTRRANHMMVIAHDLSRCLWNGNRALRNETNDMLILTHLGDRHTRYNLNCVSVDNDLVIPPHAFGFKPPQVNSTRKRLFLFLGADHLEHRKQAPQYSNGVRQELADLYKNKPDPDVLVSGYVADDDSPPGAKYRQLLSTTRFCGAPAGWASWSPRAFEAIAFGCVPVFFFAHGDVQLPWDNVLDYRQFAVFLPVNKSDYQHPAAVRTLKSTLLAINATCLKRMQERVLQVRDAFVWSRAGDDSGAMRMVLHALQERVEKLKRR